MYVCVHSCIGRSLFSLTHASHLLSYWSREKGNKRHIGMISCWLMELFVIVSLKRFPEMFIKNVFLLSNAIFSVQEMRFGNRIFFRTLQSLPKAVIRMQLMNRHEEIRWYSRRVGSKCRIFCFFFCFFSAFSSLFECITSSHAWRNASPRKWFLTVAVNCRSRNRKLSNNTSRPSLCYNCHYWRQDSSNGSIRHSEPHSVMSMSTSKNGFIIITVAKAAINAFRTTPD